MSKKKIKKIARQKNFGRTWPRPKFHEKIFVEQLENFARPRDSKTPQDPPKTVQDHPKTTQDRPKIAQDHPKTAQDRSKTKFSSKKVSKKESKRIRNLETHGC